MQVNLSFLFYWISFLEYSFYIHLLDLGRKYKGRHNFHSRIQIRHTASMTTLSKSFWCVQNYLKPQFVAQENWCKLCIRCDPVWPVLRLVTVSSVGTRISGILWWLALCVHILMFTRTYNFSDSMSIPFITIFTSVKTQLQSLAMGWKRRFRWMALEHTNMDLLC